ncbi:MAG: hypothetical protein KDE55_09795 [Novosphingobium sp.]|nr:hypothetical protein [Novosphingobium sp.]
MRNYDKPKLIRLGGPCRPSITLDTAFEHYRSVRQSKPGIALLVAIQIAQDAFGPDAKNSSRNRDILELAASGNLLAAAKRALPDDAYLSEEQDHITVRMGEQEVEIQANENAPEQAIIEALLTLAINQCDRR